MEILFEILVRILWWIIQFIGEAVLQIFGEALFELGFRSLREPFRRPRPLHPVLAAFGYLLFGLIAGGLSLWIFPVLFIDATWLRVVNVVLTPIVAGFAMSVLGSYRRRRGQEIIRLDTFSYGALFALGMAVVRFIWGH